MLFCHFEKKTILFTFYNNIEIAVRFCKDKHHAVKEVAVLILHEQQ